MSESKAEEIINYPLKMVDLIVKTNNFDTTLKVKVGRKVKQYSVKYLRSDEAMGKNMTVTVASDEIYVKLLIPNDKDEMVIVMTEVFKFMGDFHNLTMELKEFERRKPKR